MSAFGAGIRRFVGLMILGVCCVLSNDLALGQKKQEATGGGDFHWDSDDNKELTANESLSNAKIGEADKRAIAMAIIRQLYPRRKNVTPEAQAKFLKAALATRVEMTDLNGDGVAEVVAQGMGDEDCSPTGNCPLWIFQKVGNEYRLVLRSFGQSFTIQKTNTNGYRDVVISMHDSATESELKEYQFSGGMYRKVGCFDAEWEIPEGDEVQQSKEPRITQFACSGR
jgi:hypothetical protein